MQIVTNIAASMARRGFERARASLGSASERLSTGFRVNHAQDDAAGLAIAERMHAGMRGNTQAKRNVSDGVSMLATADAAIENISDLLQRVRELAVQASNTATYGPTERRSMQAEAAELLEEIDRITEETTFNGRTVLDRGSGQSVAADPDESALLARLKTAWLRQGEQLIQTYYGLTADNASLSIVFDATIAGAAAYVQGTGNPDGTLGNLELHVDVSDFVPAGSADGGTAPVYDDRIIAHELVHATMARTMNFTALPTWFKEGTAEFIHGADERLAADIAANGGGAIGAAAVVAKFGSGVDGDWTSASLDYSAAYAATRFMHERIQAMGGSGVRQVMDYLSSNPGSDLDQALTNASSGAFLGFADFVAQFQAGGSAFIQTDPSMDLANADTGAIGGLDADGGPSRDAIAVVPNIDSYTENPLIGFAEIYPSVAASTAIAETISLQVGAFADQKIEIEVLATSVSSLGLSGLDVATNSTDAITRIDSALEYVAAGRARLGAQMTRLEATSRTLERQTESLAAARSAIMDADFAKETTSLLRSEILSKGATAVLAQANVENRSALTLLRSPDRGDSRARRS